MIKLLTNDVNFFKEVENTEQDQTNSDQNSCCLRLNLCHVCLVNLKWNNRKSLVE